MQSISDNSSTATHFRNPVFLPVAAHKFYSACLRRLFCYLHYSFVLFTLHGYFIPHNTDHISSITKAKANKNPALLLLFANSTQTDPCAGNIPRATESPANVYCHFQWAEAIHTDCTCGALWFALIWPKQLSSRGFHRKHSSPSGWVFQREYKQNKSIGTQPHGKKNPSCDGTSKHGCASSSPYQSTCCNRYFA